ncbi:hypothetical protein BABINDRAFT_159433 [Babjeviella inositovora NRRL Y-12698]|uniref:Zn(2)-C6 fungal-type domain-containing protein n=1 Tax=Babjeviella inositovora NRRL Y-12698 TaxID=984486 RepID=A0A1E3QZA9_9ASCO|nr:uncharacterized protein BABINDRAFT_159433 [Babjeviella inositovora NRRL Y-12698]ODQ82955.1 hypothetical protein BABINDRAFT_159433 [Babjeviella inositovora NRRL Y-12698]
MSHSVSDEKKKRSRNGCHNCKRLKIKCDELKPTCSYCQKRNSECDYSVKLTWGGRPFKKPRQTKHDFFQVEPANTPSAAPWNAFDTRTPIGPRTPKVDGLTMSQFPTPVTPMAVTSVTPAHIPPVASSPIETIEESSFQSGISSLNHLWTKLESITNASDALNLRDFGVLDDLLTSMNDTVPAPIVLEAKPVESLPPLEHTEDNAYAVDLEKVCDYNNTFSDGLSFNLPSSMALRNQNNFYLASLTLLDDSDEPFTSLFDINDPISFFRSIPPTINPLPEILLQVPYYREIFHFYTEVTASMLVPAPAHMYKENPFRVILPRMAMQCLPILCAMLAFAAKHRSIIIGQAVPVEIIDQLISRSLNGLMAALRNESESKSDTTLATALLLLCYEVFSQNETGWRTHFVGARRIIRSRNGHKSITSEPVNREDTLGAETPGDVMLSLDGTRMVGQVQRSYTRSLDVHRKVHRNPLKRESNIGFFLIRWFAYIDVIGGLASAKPWRNPPSRYVPNNDDPEVDEDDFMTDVCLRDETENDMTDFEDIDHFMGFDIKFVPILADIVALISKRENVEADEILGTLPIKLVTEALEAKSRLMDCFEIGEKKREKRHQKILELRRKKQEERQQSTTPPDVNSPTTATSEATKISENVLRSTNRVFAYMGLINLYRRVLCVPTESPIIQQHAKDIADAFKSNIPACSNAEVCCSFALFTAGCEVMDPEYRIFFQERFTAMSKVGNIAANTALEVMMQCWESGKSWMSILKEQDIVLVFF